MLNPGRGVEQVTPREYHQANHEAEMFDKQAVHVQALKDKEIALAKLEARWNSWLKLPALIVRLPFLLVVGVGVAISVARKQTPDEKILDLLK